MFFWCLMGTMPNMHITSTATRMKFSLGENSQK